MSQNKFFSVFKTDTRGCPAPYVNPTPFQSIKEAESVHRKEDYAGTAEVDGNGAMVAFHPVSRSSYSDSLAAASAAKVAVQGLQPKICDVFPCGSFVFGRDGRGLLYVMNSHLQFTLVEIV